MEHHRAGVVVSHGCVDSYLCLRVSTETNWNRCRFQWLRLDLADSYVASRLWYGSLGVGWL